MNIRAMQPQDWDSVAEIYRQGIRTGNATFQLDAPSWEVWDESHLNDCRIVAVMDDKVVGWAALSPVSSRCVYAGVAEVSVYVSTSHGGKNIGTNLLVDIVSKSEEVGIWTLQSGIFPENKGSIRIHEKAGFRMVGYRERIGKMNGIWKDNVFMERRSSRIGIN